MFRLWVMIRVANPDGLDRRYPSGGCVTLEDTAHAPVVLGDRIRGLLKRCGMTVADLAWNSRLSPGYTSQKETYNHKGDELGFVMSGEISFGSVTAISMYTRATAVLSPRRNRTAIATPAPSRPSSSGRSAPCSLVATAMQLRFERRVSRMLAVVVLNRHRSAFRRGCVKTRSSMVGPGTTFSRRSNCLISF